MMMLMKMQLMTTFFLIKKYAQNRPIIPVSRELNEPNVEWTDNESLIIGAFPDKFLFCQGVPNGLPTQQNWKHFSLYYDG